MNAQSAPKTAATFDEMRRILRELPGPDLAAQTEVVRRQAELTKPPGSLGRLEEIAGWLAAWQGRAQPRVERPRIAVFAGTHGVAQREILEEREEHDERQYQRHDNGRAPEHQAHNHGD